MYVSHDCMRCWRQDTSSWNFNAFCVASKTFTTSACSQRKRTSSRRRCVWWSKRATCNTHSNSKMPSRANSPVLVAFHSTSPLRSRSRHSILFRRFSFQILADRQFVNSHPKNSHWSHKNFPDFITLVK